MGTTADKCSYLNQTKKDIKNAINSIGGEITDETTFRNYPLPLKEMYENLPKTDFVEGSNITLENTVKGKIDFDTVYQQVEWIESTGTQYIDTGVKLAKTSVIDIKYEYIANGFVFGSRLGNVEEYSAITNEDNNMFIVRFGNIPINIISSRLVGIVTAHFESGNSYINGSKTTNPFGDNYYNGNCYLFTINNNGSPGPENYSKNRIYYFKIKGQVELIPCYRKSDNVIGMYDKVSGRFFENAGTGTFLKGADVVGNLAEKIGFGQKSQESTTGKNLWNVLDYTGQTVDLIAHQGATITEETNKFILHTTNTTNSGAYIRNPNNNITGFTADTTYYLSFDVTSSVSTSRLVYGQGTVATSLVAGEKKRLKVDVRNTSAFVFYVNEAMDLTVENIMITIANDGVYEKYTGGIPGPNADFEFPVKSVTGEQEVTIRGSQLFQAPNAKLLTDVTLTKNEDGSLNIVGTAGANRDFSTNFIPLENTNLELGGSYYLSLGETFSGVSIQIVGYASNGSWVATNSMQSTTQGQAITLFNDSTITQIKFILRVYSGTTINQQNIKIMLNKGSTALPFEPYITPITKQLDLGNKELYEDSFIERDSNGNFYFNDNWENIHITSSMADYVALSEQYGNIVVMLVTPTIVINQSTINAYSNIAIGVAYANRTQNADCYRVMTGEVARQIILRFPAGNSINTLELAKEFINNHNINVVVKLAEIKRTPITDITLISQLEEIYNIMSLNGTTVIEINGNLPMIMKIKANTEIPQPSTETKTVKSTTSTQTIDPTSGKLISQITVEPIVLDTVSVTPSTSSQTINPTHDGIGQVNVSAVTSSIDNNIVAGNIKKDVSILGVTGTFEGGSGNVNVEAITSNNMYKNIATVDLSGATISATSLSHFFDSYSSLREVVSMPNTSSVTDVSYMFYLCTNLEEVALFNTSSVTTFEGMFLMHSSASSMKGKITDIPLFDTSHAINVSYMVACTKIVTLPSFNTSNVTNMMSMCEYCKNLVTVPILNTSNVTNLNNAFNQCSSLSNDSLNNILYMCANSSSSTAASNKTLKKVGLTSAQATTCQGLSNYSAFTNAGWTTGY